KLRQTENVARTIARLARNRKAEWQDAGQGWSGVETELQLRGWTRQRRVIVLRKKLAEQPARATGRGRKQGQACLPGAVVEQVDGDWYEYAVLVTSWEQSEVRVLAQAYRDRADAENMFDELSGRCRPSGFGI
ncbi:MAG: transposase, partial [Acidobacteriota bacterium]